MTCILRTKPTRSGVYPLFRRTFKNIPLSIRQPEGAGAGARTRTRTRTSTRSNTPHQHHASPAVHYIYYTITEQAADCDDVRDCRRSHRVDLVVCPCKRALSGALHVQKVKTQRFGFTHSKQVHRQNRQLFGQRPFGILFPAHNLQPHFTCGHKGGVGSSRHR